MMWIPLHHNLHLLHLPMSSMACTATPPPPGFPDIDLILRILYLLGDVGRQAASVHRGRRAKHERTGANLKQ